jgi:2-polyprenyl-3-methyl-5-hydroxy-6-metoxy-1,4-benzoquinol methylase
VSGPLRRLGRRAVDAIAAVRRDGSIENGQITGLLSPWLETKRIEKAVEYVDDGLEVLDVGCGRASILAYIEPMRYVGVDILEAVLESNRVRFPKHEFFARDVAAAPIDDIGAFDVIVMLAVLEHFSDPTLVLRHLGQCLKTQGRVVLATPHPSGGKLLDWGATVCVQLGSRG